jgi:ATP-binding cassette, subfamily B, bacterial PglK
VISYIQKINLLIGKKNKSKFFLTWFLSLLSSIVEIVSIAILSQYISFILNFQNKNFVFHYKFLTDFLDFKSMTNTEILFFLSLILLIFTILKNFFLLFVIFFENYIIYKIKLKNSLKLYSKYIVSDYSFFFKKNPFIIIRNLSGEMDRAHLYILQNAIALRETFLVSFIVLFLCTSNLLITFFALSVVLTFVFVYFMFFKKVLENKGKLTQELEGKLMSKIETTFNSIKEIKIFNSESIFCNSFGNYSKSYGISGLYPNIISKLPRYILEIILISIIVIIILFSINFNDNFEESISIISIFAISALRLIPALTLLSSCIASIKNLAPSFDNIILEMSYKKSKSLILEKKKDYQKYKNNSVSLKRIVFQDVCFSYEKESNFKIKNLNLEIVTGKITGIVGESGSGKSTIVDILLGLLKPDGGKILFDGKEIEYKKLFNLKIFGYVPQNTHLLESSIRENIAFGIEPHLIDDEKVISLLKMVNLYQHVFNLKNNIYEKVNYSGSNFSGGQIQRLSIARSLYFNPKFVILDESTNSLDGLNESKLLEEIKRLKNKIAFVIISHKSSTISYCDRVYNIEKGQIKLPLIKNDE